MKHITYIIILTIFSSCSQNNSKLENEIATEKITIQTEIKDSSLEKKNHPPKTGDFHCILKDSLTEVDLYLLSPSVLKLIRNEIYALHNYKFKNRELSKHFSKYNWYTPIYTNIDSALTSLEKHNIKIILEAEKSNIEISKTEMFQHFLDDIYNSPKGLKCYFTNNSFSEDFGVIYCQEIFHGNKEFTYLLLGFYLGDNSPGQLSSIDIYTKEGKFLDSFFLNPIIGDFTKEGLMQFKNQDTISITTNNLHLKNEYVDSSKNIDPYDELTDVNKYYENITTQHIIYLKNNKIQLKEITAANNI